MDEVDITLFSFVGDTLANGITNRIEPIAGRLIDALGPMISYGLTLYLAFFFLGIMGGVVQRPLGELGRVGLRVILITSLALSAEQYNGIVVNFFEGIESGLVSIVSGDGVTSIYVALDAMISSGLEITAQCIEQAQSFGRFEVFSKFSWYLAGLIVGVAALGLAITGGIAILLAKVALGLLFAFGPVFLLCLIFASLGRFFDAWAGYLINATLVIVLVGLVLSLALGMFGVYLSRIDFIGAEQSPILTSLTVAGLATLLALTIRECRSIASSLGGGIALSAITLRQTASTALSPMTNTLDAARGTRDAVDPRSTRRDIQSGMLVNARRSHHLLAGNTPINPAYWNRVAARSPLGSESSWSWGAGGRAKNTSEKSS